jgi:hypothetical protein
MNRLLEGPAIELHLQCDFDVVIFIDMPRQLRIADEIPVRIPDQKVRTANQCHGDAVKGGVLGKFALINDGHPIPDCFGCPLNPLFWPKKTRVFVSA